MIGVRDAEQLADDQRRDRQRVRRHQVGRRPGGGHGVEVVGGDALDPRFEQAHPAQREPAGEQPAEPGIAQHRAGQAPG
ncbi:hypothetical protein [Nonomuraea sp. NPDC049624]|uniref:hypothetical protein n=1 Tax=Nonomuraea sp. NPDC049624 TaxID=3154354 RepID=UPI00343FBD84